MLPSECLVDVGEDLSSLLSCEEKECKKEQIPQGLGEWLMNMFLFCIFFISFTFAHITVCAVLLKIITMRYISEL